MSGRAVAGALLLLALVAAFWTQEIALGGGDGAGLGDVQFYYYPLYEAAFGARAGERSLLWNPWELCGIPLLATLQGGLLYPPHLLYAVLPTATGMAVSSLLHLALVALSTAALSRRMGLSDPAVLVSVALATFSARYATMLLAPNTLEAAAWLPLGLFAVVGLARGETRRSAAILAGCLAASVLAGYPQATVYCVYAWGATLVFLLAGSRPGGRAVAVRLGAFTLALVIGALAAGVQLLPTAELALEGTRSLDSLSSGRLKAYPGWNEVVRPGWGLAALALFPLALLSGRRRALGVVTVLLCVTTLVFSWGPSTPAYELYLALPLLDAFRFPHRILFVTDLFFALAAGLGLDALVEAFDRRGGWTARWTVAIVGVAAGVAVLLWRGPGAGSAAVLLVVVLATGALLVSSRARLGTPRSVAFAVSSVLALGVLAESWKAPRKSWDLPYAADRYPADRMQGLPWVEEVAQRLGDGRVALFGTGPTPAVFPKLALVHGLRSANGYEPMNLHRQAEYFSFLAGGSADAAARVRPFSGRLYERPMELEGLPGRRRLLDLAAVRYVVVSNPKERAALDRFVAGLGAVPVARLAEDVQLLENRDVLPRAFLTYRVAAAPPAAELLEILGRPGFDPLASSYVEGGTVPPREGPVPRGHPARIVVDAPRLVEVEVEPEVDGWLVLADSHYPGWRASVDGEPAEIVRTNHLFRGVRVPAGARRVRFEYRPWTIWAGLGSSLVGVAVGVVAWRWRPLPRPRVEATDA